MIEYLFHNNSYNDGNDNDDDHHHYDNNNDDDNIINTTTTTTNNNNDRFTKRTHSLFIDDLKSYKESHKQMEAANEIIVRASDDTGAVYGVKKCAEILFKHGETIKGEGLMILDKKAEALDPEKKEFYKFLGIEQGKEIDNGRVMVRIRKEMRKRLENVVDLELYDKKFTKAINCRVISVAGYTMNVCQFTRKEIYDLDMLVKETLRRKGMLG